MRNSDGNYDVIPKTNTTLFSRPISTRKTSTYKHVSVWRFTATKKRQKVTVDIQCMQNDLCIMFDIETTTVVGLFVKPLE